MLVRDWDSATKIHACRVRVPRDISSETFLLFKALGNALFSCNSAWTVRHLLGRKANEAFATDSRKCINYFFLSLVSVSDQLQKQPPEYSLVAFV